MQTRKHFKQTAEIISSIKHLGARAVMFHKMAEQFAAENPRFDREKFKKACGL